jgi:putative inorganic carbon (HCO3(-)) transporter
VTTLKFFRRLAARLLPFEFWTILMAVGISMVFPRLLLTALILAGVYWIIRWLATGSLIKRTPADWGVFLLIFLVPVTLWATALHNFTDLQVMRLLTGIALFYAFVNWHPSSRQYKFLIFGTVVFAGLLAIVSPLVVDWIPTEIIVFLPNFKSFAPLPLVQDAANPNVMAGFLTLFYPLSLAILLFQFPALNRLLGGVTLFSTLAIIGGLIITQSRAALLAAFISSGTLALFRWRRAWIILPFGLLVGGIILQSFGLTLFLDTLSANPSLGGLEGRLEVWSRALYMIQDFPFTGIGMGSFTQVADTLYPFFLASPGSMMHAHNLFLQIAVDLGLLGLIAWLSVWFLVIAFAWKIYRHGRLKGSDWMAGLGAGLLASQVALGIHGLIDAVTWGQVRPAPLVWGLWGLTFAGWNVLQQGKDSLS